MSSQDKNQAIIFGDPPNNKKVLSVAADCFQQVFLFFKINLYFNTFKDSNNYADTSGRSRLQLTVPGAVISSAKGFFKINFYKFKVIF